MNSKNKISYIDFFIWFWKKKNYEVISLCDDNRFKLNNIKEVFELEKDEKLRYKRNTKYNIEYYSCEIDENKKYIFYYIYK
jgi:hypothetical protein